MWRRFPVWQWMECFHGTHIMRRRSSRKSRLFTSATRRTRFTQLNPLTPLTRGVPIPHVHVLHVQIIRTLTRTRISTAITTIFPSICRFDVIRGKDNAEHTRKDRPADADGGHHPGGAARGDGAGCARGHVLPVCAAHDGGDSDQ